RFDSGPLPPPDSSAPAMGGGPRTLPFARPRWGVAGGSRHKPPIATSVSVMDGQSETTRRGGIAGVYAVGGDSGIRERLPTQEPEMPGLSARQDEGGQSGQEQSHARERRRAGRRDPDRGDLVDRDVEAAAVVEPAEAVLGPQKE